MAKRIRTHYDNLKVAQDAPIEVIRAAYRSLCKKYHPDQNRDNPDAERIMSLVNRSYAVLSDPEQRRAHDEWIAAQGAAEKPVSSPMPKNREPEPGLFAQALYARRLWLGLLFFAALIGALFWLAGQQREAAADMPVARADTAPASYPEFAQYMAGYPVLAETGNGMVKIDNQANRSAVLAQIYPESGNTALRTIYIPPRADFTAFKLPSGSYRISYRQLADGSRENTVFTLSDGQTQATVVQLESARAGVP
ncbi:J domain-containing protein [Neisseria dentiae]|uniref:J domain-containing protein n=1 Tax=Neisseria dentiae TaxID=194197 RepID=UPI00211B8DB7|nr:DnaJ domain-containing protein [Neisseria dentiae]MCQ9327336.1 DnaJ domain-containing protein [Neisseria dentiae]